MKLLINTHALIWYVEQPAKLGPTVEATIHRTGFVPLCTCPVLGAQVQGLVK